MPLFIFSKRGFTKSKYWKTERQKSMFWRELPKRRVKRDRFLSRQKKD
jgi:hypothetical protein